MRESDSIVIIPTYNEMENIEKIIRAVFGLEKSFHILVIDDGRPDHTGDKVEELIEKEFKGSLFCLHSDLAQHISLALSGLWNMDMSISLRWMPTLVMILMTCLVCMLHATTKATM